MDEVAASAAAADHGTFVCGWEANFAAHYYDNDAVTNVDSDDDGNRLIDSD